MGDREHRRQRVWEIESVGVGITGSIAQVNVVDSANQCTVVDGSTIGSVHSHSKLQSLTLRTVM